MATGRVTGNAGCNNYFASYTVSGTSIQIVAPRGVTRRACAEPDGVMAQEDRFFKALTGAAQFRLSAGRLELRDAADSLLATFEPTERHSPLRGHR